jgi:hypothetical protein
MTPELAALFSAATGVLIQQSNSDLLLSQRSHERYLQTMERSFLSDTLEEAASMAKTAANLSTASHVPYPQPWSPTTRAA